MLSSSTVRRFKRGLEGCRPKLSLRLCLFQDGFLFDVFGFLVVLPFLDRYARMPHEIMESWGVYYFERSIWFCWGDRSKSFRMPWDMEHIKCEVQRPDGSWVPYVASYETDKEPDGRWEETYPYHYRLESGDVQERNATVYVERREWRQRWLKWCPWFVKRRQSIDVRFDDEVGEGTGSWKGGCIGCGYDMKPGEKPLDTLRRMESERKFQ